MARQEAHITGSVLTWAIDESGLSRDEVADKLKVAVSDIESWESERARPSQGKLTKLAQALFRQRAVFYLPSPPESVSVPADFRQAPGLGEHKLSSQELLKIRESRRLQEMLAWIQQDADELPIELPNYGIDEDVDLVAQDFREFIGVFYEDQLSWQDESEAFKNWRAALEDTGIFAIQLSLGKKSIRGFATWNDYAPLVAVNTAYNKTARIYTLFHEIGHILTRKDASCLEFLSPKEANSDSNLSLERWCEQFSASFLMPSEIFCEIALYENLGPNKMIQDIDTVIRIAKKFNVSIRATSLRLQELGLAPSGFYSKVINTLSNSDWPNSGGGGKGRFVHRKRLDEFGVKSIETLFNAQKKNRINALKLADYLNLTTGQVDDLRNIIPEFA